MKSFPRYVKLVEVSPRDGLQNESKIIPTDIKIQFIDQLSETGLSVIEVTSFVSPKWIPQLADHREVFQKIMHYPNIEYPVLVPNTKGLETALSVGVKEVAVFTTPSETFCQHNTNTSVAENFSHIHNIMQIAKRHNVRVRGYLSCVLGCPYEGDVLPIAVTDMAEKLMDLGCYEISLGDTIGIGTPAKTKKLLDSVMKKIS